MLMICCLCIFWELCQVGMTLSLLVAESGSLVLHFLVGYPVFSLLINNHQVLHDRVSFVIGYRQLSNFP